MFSIVMFCVVGTHAPQLIASGLTLATAEYEIEKLEEIYSGYGEQFEISEDHADTKGLAW
jgi:hypothetical protein